MRCGSWSTPCATARWRRALLSRNALVTLQPVTHRDYVFSPPATPIAEDVIEHTFCASHDGSAQTYLVKDFRASRDEVAPLLVIYLHGANSHQEQGMTAEIYDNAFGRLAEEWKTREAVYLCPEYRGSSWMGAAAEADLLDILRLAK